ncbi:MAG: hypothetical protein J7K75_10315 [Desulfuromonas sp.]|nr:hypothetical protein [Desulfuromonas sp.]
MKFVAVSMSVVRFGLLVGLLFCVLVACHCQIAVAEITFGSDTPDDEFVVLQFADAEPVAPERVAPESVVRRPVPVAPTVDESAALESVVTDLVASQSAAVEPVVVEPTALDAIVTQLVAKQNDAATVEPIAVDPGILANVFADDDVPEAGTPIDPAIDDEIIYHPPAEFSEQPLPADAELQRWIAGMKTARRGPFKRIRWFCADGYIYPPDPYGCSAFGGGVQHGEWTDRVKQLRAHGYLVANVLADLQPEAFVRSADWSDRLKQMLLEQFLVTADDGWILRKARFYRGALQIENEAANGRAILEGLLSRYDLSGNRFLLLREAARLLPHGRYLASLSKMRQLSRSIAEQDAGFESLRTKLHVRPEPGDAVRIREYSSEQGLAELEPDYQQLATALAELYQPRPLIETIEGTAALFEDSALAWKLRLGAERLNIDGASEQRYAALCSLLALVRDGLQTTAATKRQQALLHLSLDLEQAVFTMANAWLEQLPQANRRQTFDWLQHSVEALYGIGLLSPRERRVLQRAVPDAEQMTLTVAEYMERVATLARVPEWAEGTLHQLFAPTVQHWSRIEPLAALYLPDRLRGSPLAAYATVADHLSGDGKQLLGIRSELFGEVVATGINALNPGLARGRLLRWQPGMALSELDSEAIYILPETVAELPRVAGIITAGRGNALSHVQLLARNLAIPNVAIEKRLLDRLEPYLGQTVVLAGSPAGVVLLAQDGLQWQALFEKQAAAPLLLIEPDLDKLDLTVTDMLPLERLTIADSGRVAGPKAANLGELKVQFPELVADGLVVPFGVFRQFLQQPLSAGGPMVFDWLRQQYAEQATISDATLRQRQTLAMLARLRDWITTTPFSAALRQQLWQAMQHKFGNDGSYGVFVRSDTNVEDLPGFSGAGLNKTVPHVVGFEAIVKAIRQVWASPFTERAYSWRQAHMPQPEQLYASVLLMKSVPVAKSGVLVTQDIFSGRRDHYTVAINEGIGGAVAGQRAEELLLDAAGGDDGGNIQLLTQASEPMKRMLADTGGITKVAASGADAVLSEDEARILVEMGRSLPQRFAGLRDGQDGRDGSQAADIEFGFVDGRFVLFQIRPFVESGWARDSRFLAELDGELGQHADQVISLDQRSEEGR